MSFSIRQNFSIWNAGIIEVFQRILELLLLILVPRNHNSEKKWYQEAEQVQFFIFGVNVLKNEFYNLLAFSRVWCCRNCILRVRRKIIIWEFFELEKKLETGPVKIISICPEKHVSSVTIRISHQPQRVHHVPKKCN